jgi:hypothetical protein
LGRDADGPAVAQAAAVVNRYVVDRVTADLMLGFFFPGAEMVVTGGRAQTAAGAQLDASVANGAASPPPIVSGP